MSAETLDCWNALSHQRYWWSYSVRSTHIVKKSISKKGIPNKDPLKKGYSQQGYSQQRIFPKKGIPQKGYSQQRVFPTRVFPKTGTFPHPIDRNPSFTWSEITSYSPTYIAIALISQSRDSKASLSHASFDSNYSQFTGENGSLSFFPVLLGAFSRHYYFT